MMNGMVKNNITYKTIEGIPDSFELKQLEELYESVFDDAQVGFFLKRIQEKEHICSIIAFESKKPIGFKIGYHYNKTTFYSWVGGILEEYRKLGVGKKLAQLQEQWAKDNFYSILRTKSMNRFKPMMILNIKNGFNIVDLYTNSSNQTKIVFEKNLI